MEIEEPEKKDQHIFQQIPPEILIEILLFLRKNGIILMKCVDKFFHKFITEFLESDDKRVPIHFSNFVSHEFMNVTDLKMHDLFDEKTQHMILYHQFHYQQSRHYTEFVNDFADRLDFDKIGFPLMKNQLSISFIKMARIENFFNCDRNKLLVQAIHFKQSKIVKFYIEKKKNVIINFLNDKTMEAYWKLAMEHGNVDLIQFFDRHVSQQRIQSLCMYFQEHYCYPLQIESLKYLIFILEKNFKWMSLFMYAIVYFNFEIVEYLIKELKSRNLWDVTFDPNNMKKLMQQKLFHAIIHDSIPKEIQEKVVLQEQKLLTLFAKKHPKWDYWMVKFAKKKNRTDLLKFLSEKLSIS